MHNNSRGICHMTTDGGHIICGTVPNWTNDGMGGGGPTTNLIVPLDLNDQLSMGGRLDPAIPVY